MTKSIANWIACVKEHSFAHHFHIYFCFSLQLSETLTIYAPNYNYRKPFVNKGSLRDWEKSGLRIRDLFNFLILL